MTRRIAVDAMGGDHAPLAEVEGAVAAVRERPELEVVLVGDEPRLLVELSRHGARSPRIHLRHATQIIAMDDAPSAAVKKKKDSSMRVCFDLAKRGEVGAVVSAGNSGAMLACGIFVMKRIRGVDRPGILATAPQRDGRTGVVLDVGANTEVKPQTLAQYGVMGATYSRLILGVTRPRVAVLANGEESSKGTALTREAVRLLGREGVTRDFDFVGYVEGRHLFDSQADVIVTDGFTGNVTLKTVEGLVQVLIDRLKQEIAGSLRLKLGALLLEPAFTSLKRLMAWDEYGGAPLLGVDGVAIICHGRSNAKAIMNGILTADRFVGNGLAPAIAESIARHAPLWAEDVAPHPTDHRGKPLAPSVAPRAREG